jgi:hypothetical protein
MPMQNIVTCGNRRGPTGRSMVRPVLPLQGTGALTVTVGAPVVCAMVCARSCGEVRHLRPGATWVHAWVPEQLLDVEPAPRPRRSVLTTASVGTGHGATAG